jgi:hypothetical protein
MDSSARATELIGDLSDGPALRVKAAHSNGIDRDARSAEALPFRARVSESGANTLHNQTSLKLSYGTQNGEDHLARWCAGVHLLRIRNEVDAQRFERL